MYTLLMLTYVVAAIVAVYIMIDFMVSAIKQSINMNRFNKTNLRDRGI